MKIIQIITYRCEEYPNLLYVEIETDEGYVGLGETFLAAATVEEFVHEALAGQLLNEDATAVEWHAGQMRSYLGGGSSGVENRALSAIDIALWDIRAQSAGVPLASALGGPAGGVVPIYNTCAGPEYIRKRPVQSVDNWGIPEIPTSRDYEDLQAFLTRPGELARDLLESGVRAMKVWPFDTFAEASRGQFISTAELRQGSECLAKIREAVGDEMDILLELHGLWNVSSAKRISRAIEEYSVLWIEDPVRAEYTQALETLADATKAPLACSETLAGSGRFLDLLSRGIIDVAIADVGWAGGITEARKVAAVAESFQVPVALHDCTGPVVLTASTHATLAFPNAFMQETVRAFYYGYYQDIVTELPHIDNGKISPPSGNGLGVQLTEHFKTRPDTQSRRSSLTAGNYS